MCVKVISADRPTDREKYEPKQLLRGEFDMGAEGFWLPPLCLSPACLQGFSPEIYGLNDVVKSSGE